MKKDLLKIMLVLLITASLFCGCSTDKQVGTNREESVTQEEKSERVSEYGENDKPWGEYNYKNIGIIENLNKDLDNNYVTADFTVDSDGTKDKVKIYGTDMNISDYENRKVFVAAVNNTDNDKDYVLVKFYKDITLVDEDLLKSISNLDSVDNNDSLNEAKSRIESLSNSEYKAYVNGLYNDKLNELSIKKQNDEKVRKDAEAKAAQERNQKAEVQEQQDRQQQQSAPSNNAQPNGETVYVASSGKGECYHKDPNCSKMKGNANSMSRSEAEQKKLRPCKKCYK